MKFNHILPLLGLILGTATGSAATVTFCLYVDQDSAGIPAPGTFNLYAIDSVGDNFGIASYGAPLIGSILTIDHKSPRATQTPDFATFNAFGFSFLRTGDVPPPIGLTPYTISASQDTISPTPYPIYGFGQRAGNLLTEVPATVLGPEQPVFTSLLLLASGTYNAAGTRPDFNLADLDLGANTFDTSATLDASAATILTRVIPVPEPSSVALIGMACFGFMARRRCS